MAIKKSFDIKGIAFIPFFNAAVEMGEANFKTQEFYIKVESVSGSKSQASANTSFSIDGAVLLRRDFAFTPSMDGENFISQAYSHIKSLPEFYGAEDC